MLFGQLLKSGRETISRNYMEALFLREGTAGFRESIRRNEPELLSDPEVLGWLHEWECREAAGESRASILGLGGLDRWQ